MQAGTSFLQVALDSLCKFNATFQLDLPMLPALESVVKHLLRLLLGWFVTAAVSTKCGDDLGNTDNMVPDTELGIGRKQGPSFMNHATSLLNPSMESKIYDEVRAFYTTIASTIINRFNFKDDLVNDIATLLPEYRATVTPQTVVHITRHFVAAVLADALDSLEEEDLDYTLAPISTLLVVKEEEGKPTSGAELCKYGQAVGMMKCLDNTARFKYLSKLAKCLLALPHSNADTERVFSIVRKIVTDLRTEMDQSTLCPLLSCKLNSDIECYRLEAPKELLNKAKHATMEYNRAHTSKDTE